MFASRAALMTGPRGLKGSVAFSSSDSLTASGSAFTLAGAFTIECWYYASTFVSNWYLFDFGSNGTRIQLYNNNAYFIPASGPYIMATAGVGFATNTWHHIAMQRSVGNNIYAFINGQFINFFGNATNFGETSCRINGYGPGGIGGNGYISNFRVVLGSAIYPEAGFTPPTSALTAVSGTSILTCRDPLVIKDNGPNALSIGVNGGAAPSTFSPF